MSSGQDANAADSEKQEEITDTCLKQKRERASAPATPT